jgi:carboxymethylenebutenolidase
VKSSDVLSLLPFVTMVIVDGEYVELATPSGPMRTYIVRPAAPGKYPAIIFYSEIFQVTGPIRRTAAMLAGHGYIVAMPEVYHEYEAPGVALAYDQAGADRGNFLKTHKPLGAYDADARAAIEYLLTRPDCSGKLGAMGICMGGHLAFRTAMNPEIAGTVCFYATDIHAGTLGLGKQDDSLARAIEIQGELFMAWGRQDPHVPMEGRMKLLTRLNELNTRLNWHEVNGAHAFLRDEGARYDPEHANNMMALALSFFHRKLGQGDLPAVVVGASEARH